VCVSVLSTGAGGGNELSPGNTSAPNFEATASPSISLLMTTLFTGTKGSISATNNYQGGSNSFAQQTLCFKPTTTIALVDTVMPDGGVSVAYSAQLHGIGGTAAYTYACTGLPSNGLSLDTSTGIISGATPTAGTVSIGCTVTDGTNTSATDNLTITIGVLRSVTIRQTVNTWSGDVGASTTINSLACGDILVWFARGDDTHGGQGWVQAASGTNNKVTDTFNSPVRRFAFSIPGQGSWPLVAYVLGPITQAGNDTVNIIDNQSASSGRPKNMIYNISGGNVVDDIGGAANAMLNTASSSFATSYTTVVPNTLLLSASDTNTGLTTFSVSAPFSTDSIGGDVQGSTVYSHAFVSSPSSVTATSSFTGGSTTQQTYDGLIVPVRPTIAPASCPVSTGAGEELDVDIF